MDIPGLASMALPVEVLSLVCARDALSWTFLHWTVLHALVLGGLGQEGAGLLFGSGLADAEHDVGGGIGGPWALEQPNQRGSSTAGCSASGGAAGCRGAALVRLLQSPRSSNSSAHIMFCVRETAAEQ